MQNKVESQEYAGAGSDSDAYEVDDFGSAEAHMKELGVEVMTHPSMAEDIGLALSAGTDRTSGALPSGSGRGVSRSAAAGLSFDTLGDLGPGSAQRSPSARPARGATPSAVDALGDNDVAAAEFLASWRATSDAGAAQARSREASDRCSPAPYSQSRRQASTRKLSLPPPPMHLSLPARSAHSFDQRAPSPGGALEATLSQHGLGAPRASRPRNPGTQRGDSVTPTNGPQPTAFSLPSERRQSTGQHDSFAGMQQAQSPGRYGGPPGGFDVRSAVEQAAYKQRQLPPGRARSPHSGLGEAHAWEQSRFATGAHSRQSMAEVAAALQAQGAWEQASDGVASWHECGGGAAHGCYNDPCAPPQQRQRDKSSDRWPALARPPRSRPGAQLPRSSSARAGPAFHAPSSVSEDATLQGHRAAAMAAAAAAPTGGDSHNDQQPSHASALESAQWLAEHAAGLDEPISAGGAVNPAAARLLFSNEMDQLMGLLKKVSASPGGAETLAALAAAVSGPPRGSHADPMSRAGAASAACTGDAADGAPKQGFQRKRSAGDAGVQQPKRTRTRPVRPLSRATDMVAPDPNLEAINDPRFAVSSGAEAPDAQPLHWGKKRTRTVKPSDAAPDLQSPEQQALLALARVGAHHMSQAQMGLHREQAPIPLHSALAPRAPLLAPHQCVQTGDTRSAAHAGAASGHTSGSHQWGQSGTHYRGMTPHGQQHSSIPPGTGSRLFEPAPTAPAAARPAPVSPERLREALGPASLDEYANALIRSLSRDQGRFG
jgi:hypothetical protein